MKLSLNTLCELFGNHYGSSFYLLGTVINDITYVLKLVDNSVLSPLEIHEKITYKK